MYVNANSLQYGKYAHTIHKKDSNNANIAHINQAHKWT